MFEALVALTLLSMEPPHGNAGVEWAKNIKTFTTELDIEKSEPKKQTSTLEIAPNQNRSELDLSVPDEHIFLTDVEHIFDTERLADNKGSSVVSEAKDYPAWGWFKKHQNWLSIDRRVLKTRGDDALFQDWSPL